MDRFIISGKNRERTLAIILPFILGFGGLFLAQEITFSKTIKFVLEIFSISIPLILSFILVSRYRSTRTERMLLGMGLLLLTGSGIWFITQTSIQPLWVDVLPENIARITAILGFGSFLLGIFAFTFILIRRGRDIQELAEQFKTLAELISEGVVLSDASGKIVDVNNSFCRILSISKEDIIGRTILEISSTYNVDEVGSRWFEREQGVSGEYEVKLAINNQVKYLWIHGIPLFDNKGRHKATLATVKDITEIKKLNERVQKHAEELQRKVEEQTKKIRDSERQLKELIMTMNEGFVLLNKKYKIILVNDRFCSMLGKTREEVIGKEIFEFIVPESKVSLYNLLEKSSTTSRKEMDFINTSGKKVPTLVSISVVTEAEEEKYSLVITDLSVQKRMQRELEEHTKELERLNEELKTYGKNKDAFLSNVSHELRTPISTIQGYIEMLLSRSLGELTPRQQEALEIMFRNIQRLLRMVNEMIEFSRMEIKGVQIKKKLFLINELVNESMIYIKPKVVAKQQELLYENENDRIYIWADKDKLSQVIGILLNNAVKFTDMNGKIRITTKKLEQNTLLISVSDTGIGIPPEYHERIFEKFFQVDSSPSRKYEGTGIGLAVAKSVVEAHKGKITVESEVGKGSTFNVYLPNCIFNSDTFDETQFEFENILIIDNEPTLWKSLQDLLPQFQDKIEYAKNPYEGIRSFGHFTFDLIVVNTYDEDLESVFNTVQLIRETPMFIDIPIICIMDESKNIQNSYLENMPDYVYLMTKPFTINKFIGNIQTIISNKSQITLRFIDSGKDWTENQKIIALGKIEEHLQDIIEFTLTMHGFSCIHLSNIDNIESVYETYKPILFVIDIDNCSRHEKEKCLRFSENAKAKVVFTSIEPVNYNNVICLPKPFFTNDLLSIIKEEKTTLISQ